MIKKYSIFLFSCLLIFGIISCNETPDLPDAGDEVVIYQAKYTPSEFEKAKKVHPEGFGRAMDESGQDRITYFLEDKENNQIIAISFFINESTIKEWHSYDGRDEIIKTLKPMLREPISHKKLIVIDVHSTDN